MTNKLSIQVNNKKKKTVFFLIKCSVIKNDYNVYHNNIINDYPNHLSIIF